MKKLIITVMCLVLFAAVAFPAGAQTRYRRNPYYNNGAYSRYYGPRRSYYNYGYDNRSFWQKHRDKLTLAGGALGGALIGGIAGGRKGAGIGALVGTGASALYTYKLRNRYRRY